MSFWFVRRNPNGSRTYWAVDVSIPLVVVILLLCILGVQAAIAEGAYAEMAIPVALALVGLALLALARAAGRSRPEASPEEREATLRRARWLRIMAGVAIVLASMWVLWHVR
ncbi:MAG: hypothetical protein FJ278_25560 [Planctomycetes bacterium]|nr:hypothetical protein [Planctomycetota bacterium]